MKLTTLNVIYSTTKTNAKNPRWPFDAVKDRRELKTLLALFVVAVLCEPSIRSFLGWDGRSAHMHVARVRIIYSASARSVDQSK